MWSSFAALALAFDIPVDPSAIEGQKLAEEELARSIYSQKPSFLSQFIQPLLDFLARTKVAGIAGSPLLLILVVLLLVAAAVITIRFARRATRARAGTPAPRLSHALFDDARSANQLRRDAENHRNAGRYTAAFLDLYRAMIRALDERVLLDDRPGLTAREAADLATIPFPAAAERWQWAAAAFDAGRYGQAALCADDVDLLAAFDREITKAQPVHSPTPLKATSP